MNLDDQEVMMIARIVARLKGMSPEEKEEWFRKAMEAFVEGEANYLQGFDLPGVTLCSWETFYRDLFGWELDFSTLVIPRPERGFDRLLVVPQGLTPESLYAKCRELFSCWKYTDNLDSITSERDSAKIGTYAIWVRGRKEADEEMKNKSADDFAASGIKGITLPERLLYELKYFMETKKHLDMENLTNCTGSRDTDGEVPFVTWHVERGWMDVDRFYSGHKFDRLRARAVIA